MADVIDVGAVAENGLGDKLRVGGQAINAKFTADDILIAANISDIATNVADILALPVKGFAKDVDTADYSMSSTTYADTGILLNYTPITASNTMRLDFSALLYEANTQVGVVIELNYSLDNGSSYSQKQIYTTSRDTATGALTRNKGATVFIDVPASPATPLACIFKLNMKVITNAVAATIKGATQDTILQVTEIKE